MVFFTADQLRRFAPVAKDEFVSALVDLIDEINDAGINSLPRLHDFLSQIAVETGGLKDIEENLNYSAERLVAVWPNRFPSVAKAKPFAKNPKALANKVYGGRLGNVKPNDGWDYRGSSAIQTTGRSNFAKAGFEDNPDELRTNYRSAVRAALKFWTDNGCNRISDTGNETDLREKINGGTHGLDQAKNYKRKAKTIFTSASAPSRQPSLTKSQIEALQQKLKDLGYVKVGKVDGYIGSDTIGAISSFQAEQGLTINGSFDVATLEAIENAVPRPLSATRVGEVPDSRIIKASRTLKNGALGLMGAAGLSEAAGPLSMLEMVSDKYQKLKTALGPFQGVTDFVIANPLIIVAAIAGGVWLLSKSIEKARIEDHETGRTA